PPSRPPPSPPFPYTTLFRSGPAAAPAPARARTSRRPPPPPPGCRRRARRAGAVRRAPAAGRRRAPAGSPRSCLLLGPGWQLRLHGEAVGAAPCGQGAAEQLGAFAHPADAGAYRPSRPRRPAATVVADPQRQAAVGELGP